MNPLPLFKQLTGACLLAAGCALIGLLAAPPAAAQLKTGGTLRYAYAAGPGTLDPYVSSSAVELEVIHHLFEALVTIGEKYETKPMVAEGWQITDDAKTFTFKLRRGIRFHDGSTLTSADVLASFERYRRISPNAVVLNDVKSVEAPDANTFIVKLNKTNAVFVEILKSPVYPFVILPKGQKDKAPREVDIIGTGPFKLGEWVKDSHLVLQRFDGYVPNTSYAGNDGYAGRRTVYLDAVRYAFIGEPNARVAALQAGDTDVVAGLLTPPTVAVTLSWLWPWGKAVVGVADQVPSGATVALATTVPSLSLISIRAPGVPVPEKVGVLSVVMPSPGVPVSVTALRLTTGMVLLTLSVAGSVETLPAASVRVASTG
jgi:ABC-type transport system substrate-binding protein